MTDHFANLQSDDLDDVLNAPAAAAKAPPEGYKPPSFVEPCKKCRGSGRYIGWGGRTLGQCFTCNGTGKQVFSTSPAQRAQARVARTAKKANDTKANLTAFAQAQPEIWAWIESARAGFPFAQAMHDAIAKYGDLTDKHLAACQKCVDGRKRAQEAQQVRAAAAPAVDTSKIELALSTAFANGLKSPKLRVAAFKFSKASPASANPGAVYVKEGSEYLGKIMGGKFHAVRSCGDERQAQIVEAAADPKAAAIAYGRMTGSCSCCGRELTDPVSVEKGIGPICEEKFGW